MTAHRIRHGVYHHPILGYRAMREIDGHREWISPWGSEAAADAACDQARAALREAAAQHDITLTDRPNPDIGIWTPTNRSTTPP